MNILQIKIKSKESEKEKRFTVFIIHFFFNVLNQSFVLQIKNLKEKFRVLSNYEFVSLFQHQ